MKIRTNGREETKKLGRRIAGVVLRMQKKRPATGGAIVLALRGDLGSGKTTFVQGFARGFGVRAVPRSPTFILMQMFSVEGAKAHKRRMVHIDAYRFRRAKDIVRIGVREIFRDSRTVVLVEWADKVKKFLPKNTLWMSFSHGGKEARDITMPGRLQREGARRTKTKPRERASS